MMAILSGRLRAAVIVASAALLSACSSYAQTTAARFDLTGPHVDVRVTRDGKTLPIAAVPNLKPGDKLWLHPDLPPTQSVHYLLVAAFLRGTTNPPPDNWFTKIETWNKKVREEGVTITVPDEAQQAILFLAPETGGDFTTLRSAVQGRPGIFVRASQDLAEAGFEQARIEKYLASIRQRPAGDPKALLEHSDLPRPHSQPQAQPGLLQQARRHAVHLPHPDRNPDPARRRPRPDRRLHALATATAPTFINAATYTALGGGGLYSAYVGAVVDLVRLMGNLHTAQYQYIPAIAFPRGEAAQPPPQHPSLLPQSQIRHRHRPSRHSERRSSAPARRRPQAHHLPAASPPSSFPSKALRSSSPPASPTISCFTSTAATPRPTSRSPPTPSRAASSSRPPPERKPLPSPADDAVCQQADADKPTSASKPALSPGSPQTPVTGTITGFWGFDPFTGPTLPLQDVPGRLEARHRRRLIAGRDNHLTLTSTGTACIDSITFEPASGRQAEVPWKHSDKPNVVDVTLSLKSVDPGNIHLDVHQYGGAATAAVTAQTFSEPAQLNALHLHAGDTPAALTGTSLDQVRQITLNNLTFSPTGQTFVSRRHHDDAGPLACAASRITQSPKLHAGDHLIAHVSLRDGRTLSLPVNVAPPRPSVTLLSRNIAQPHVTQSIWPTLMTLPISQQLTFSLRSTTPFPRDGKVEIANADDSLRTDLTVASGSLVLQNSRTLLATFDPLKTFGTSAFGPLRLRAVAPDGTPGDWLPLATLVRLPTLAGPPLPL